MQKLGIGSFISEVVSTEEVKVGKPDPETFILASHKLGVRAEECLVIEDSPMGIKAARKAGMRCIGIATTHPKEELEQADLVVEDIPNLWG